MKKILIISCCLLLSSCSLVEEVLSSAQIVGEGGINSDVFYHCGDKAPIKECGYRGIIFYKKYNVCIGKYKC